MKFMNYIWLRLIECSEELYEFRQRYYGTRIFDRYI